MNILSILNRFALAAIISSSVASASATRTAESPLPSSATTTDSLKAEQDSVPDCTELEAVTVVAKKDLITSDGSKLTYDVENDPAAGSSTVIEMLRHVPMVTVDGEDNIKVKGESNFKIYINGKEDPMLSGDPKSVLKSMPASSIRKIEVITDPGAKYEAEGTGGILNIITDRKQALEGYLATLRAGISRYGANAGLYARAKINKVTASLNLSHHQGALFPNTSIGKQERENLLSATDRLYSVRSETRTERQRYDGVQFNMSWEPDTLNLFTLSASMGNHDNLGRTKQWIAMANAADEPLWSYRRDYDSDSNSLWGSLSASYQHTFPHRDGHTLTMTYQCDPRRSRYVSDTESYDFANMDGAILPYMRRRQRTHSASHTFQADYTLPLLKGHTFEAGAKALIRPDVSTDWIEGSHTGAEYAEQSHARATQHNDVYAAYASWNGTFGALSSRAGVRYEHTLMGMDYAELRGGDLNEDFRTRLNDLVPNASVTWSMSQSSNLRLAYTMRISRPWLSALNPYRNTMTYGEVSYGNPGLRSARYNNVALKYSNYGGNVSGEASIEYSHNGNMVSQYQFMREGVLHSTYANIGHRNQAQAAAYVQWQITGSMDASVYLSCAYTDYRSRSEHLDVKRHGWNTMMNANYSYTAPFGLRVDAYGGFGTPEVSLQSRQGSWNYYGLSLSHSMLKNKALTLSCNAQNFFRPRYTYRVKTETDSTMEHYTYNYAQWNVGVSISYRFGTLKSDVRRTRAQVNNDDADTSGTTTKKGQ